MPGVVRAPVQLLLPEAMRRERLDDVLCKLRQLVKGFDYRVPLENVNLAERYAAGNLDVWRVFSTKVDDAVCPEVRDCHAVIQAALGSRDEPDLAIHDPDVTHERGCVDCAQRHEIA